MNALILVDIQNDFLPGGALAVPRGDEVIAIANAVLRRFELVITTQDWHPAAHKSFAANHPGRAIGEVIDLDGLPQVLWPTHCVQGSPGAEFAPSLERSTVSEVFRKGTDVEIDSYSGFFDNGHRRATGLGDYLAAHDVDELFVMGLATDYCVKFTALDAVGLGLTTRLIVDGCRGVELNTGDCDGALAEMRAAGVELVNSGDVP